MKNHSGLYLLLIIITGICFGQIACSPDPPDPCENIACQNNIVPTASGDECSCVCPVELEGEYCELFVREKYTGVFDGTEKCLSADSVQTTIIIEYDNDSPAKEFTIQGLFEPSIIVIAEIGHDHTFEIQEQEVNTANYAYTVSGTGEFIMNNSAAPENIVLNYIVTQEGISIKCQANF